MAIIAWSVSYSIGLEQIDEQHEHLFLLLNKLYDDFTNGTSAQALDTLIEELIDYATYHFANEEKQMQDIDFPELQIHKAEHAIFSRRICEIERSYQDGGKHLTLELLAFLHNWLVTHILHSDMKFGRFIAGANTGRTVRVEG